MAGQTTYYQLETYESSDVPDLRDQYNSSMSKIDAALNTIANTATSAASGVSGAVADATAALSAASSALESATAAQTAAQLASSDANNAINAASAAQTTANTALSGANTANSAITTINQKINALELGSVLLADSGSFTATSVPANGYLDTNITYTTEFPSIPGVYTNVSSGSTAAGMGNFEVGTVNETTTGCTIRCWNASDTARTPHIRWLAALIMER